MHKKYCLVVTDDYTRFSWVFFLRTKDETSEILKNFIKEIENPVDKKVKIIRSDNGTEFKSNVLDEFCREKGIKREYSVARTPQQIGVAERKNRTLIEAARTMLADSKLPTTFWAEANNSTADQQADTANPEVNTCSRLVSTTVPEVYIATSKDLVGPSSTFEEEVGDQEIELGNLSPSYTVPTTPHTRLHKDH
ncbi:putative ribonuclease H-like domain-containing protein, partial [Tanacetum coccineum]